MFVDELTITAKAGKGGDGVTRWRHLKGKELSGPSGGDGGRGGDVYLRAVRDISLLAKYKHKKKFVAGDGSPGESESRHGKAGDDCYIDVPVGSVITHTQTSRVYELLQEGEVIKILQGGKGGLGNEHFKSSINRSPQEATKGLIGESGTFYIELKLVVDVGLIGLPNAGKSSLLNALTRASSKVGAYPFTTLSPNLGDMYGYILADIPGLIEGASSGKGLGHTFLRHIARTKLLLHCISLEHENVVAAYNTLRGELEAYGSGIPQKRELIVLTKADLVSKEVRTASQEELARGGRDVFAVSVLDEGLLKAFRDRLIMVLNELV